MPTLNHAKVIQGVEKALKGKHEDFIFEFLKAYGTSAATLKRLKLGDRSRNLATVPGDIVISRDIYFRAVSPSANLTQHLTEIRASSVFCANRIRFILITDFQTVLAYDVKVDDTLSCELAELKANYDFFLPLTGKYEKAVAYSEHPADVKACTKMGRLYDSIRAVNHYTADDLHTLNIFLTRLLFCFFAEDTEIFPEENMLTRALESHTKTDGSDVAEFFVTLFKVLDMPKDDERREKLPTFFRVFPYVNGNIFSEQSKVPQFDAKTRRLLIDCGAMKWREISPAIFGSMFQAVMDPELRRSLGAHYTSEQNIFKVIRPLFLDELESELEDILGSRMTGKSKVKALEEFQGKLARLGFLDPACGSGNFLIIAYRELRRLEIRALEVIRKLDPQHSLRTLDVSALCKVSIDQFHGIELLEFPVDIARISLHLMEHMMNLELGKACGLTLPSIPLRHTGNIVCANALTTDWKDIVKPQDIDYIFGNPPFGGAYQISRTQKKEIEDVFHDISSAGVLDYVTAWYRLAAEFIRFTDIHVAFVSTNSICQGEQPSVLWTNLIKLGCHIDFAHQTFSWKNEAKNNAAVYCIIVGFSSSLIFKTKKLYIYKNINEQPIETVVSSINPYLHTGDMTVVCPSTKALSAKHNMRYGNKPTDGGFFIFTNEEKEEFLSRQPEARSYIYKMLGAQEFINCTWRWCLWLVNAGEEILELPYIKERIRKRTEFLLASKAESTRKFASETPHLFRQITQPEGCDCLLIPSVSSERRNYIPIGYIDKNIKVNNSVHIVPNATLYDFAIITSAMHMSWMRTVCGRLEMRYRYSRDLCYNTFPWPESSEDQKQTISDLADGILAARDEHPDMSLGQMYNPETMPEDLKSAHQKLDAAVDRLYNPKGFTSDEDRLKTLFAMYADLVKAH